MIYKKFTVPPITWPSKEDVAKVVMSIQTYRYVDLSPGFFERNKSSWTEFNFASTAGKDD